ncbi:hypothetical protein LTR84_008421 [Exophiala bonariae]|uniref:Isochorismatase-like domain-containing protein n=1 Tax=Exophiala bonariae TaxID=1690606 RepID=A0AAV9N0E3_9EURO|nr:hypothetical protein LTR84_008421 [Exophiala bonariae]
MSYRDTQPKPVFFTFSDTIMASKTALVLIDVYNDFLHPNGKLYGGLAESLKDSNTIEHLEAVLDAARKHNIPTFYSLHQQYRKGKYAGFEHQNAMLQSIQQNQAFEEGAFGSEVFKSLAPNVEKGDTLNVSQKHLADYAPGSSFENTDLDWLLRQHSITHLVFAGLVVNSCIETTAREANERGYNITMLSDATAGWSTEGKNASVQHSWPAFASQILETRKWIETL